MGFFTSVGVMFIAVVVVGFICWVGYLIHDVVATIYDTANSVAMLHSDMLCKRDGNESPPRA